MRIATIRETAEYLRIGLSSLYKEITTDPTFPHSFKVGGNPVFNLDAIMDFRTGKKSKCKGRRTCQKTSVMILLI